jgi:hypothetical protein
LVRWPYAGGQRTVPPRGCTVDFSRMQKSEIQVATRFGCQSVKQARFAVMYAGRPFKLVGLGRCRREALAYRLMLNQDEAI